MGITDYNFGGRRGLSCGIHQVAPDPQHNHSRSPQPEDGPWKARREIKEIGSDLQVQKLRWTQIHVPM